MKKSLLFNVTTWMHVHCNMCYCTLLFIILYQRKFKAVARNPKTNSNCGISKDVVLRDASIRKYKKFYYENVFYFL